MGGKLSTVKKLIPGLIGENRTSVRLPVWMLMKRSSIRRMTGWSITAVDVLAEPLLPLLLLLMLVVTMFSLESAPLTALACRGTPILLHLPPGTFRLQRSVETLRRKSSVLLSRFSLNLSPETG
ncbi:hypothetical protein [Herbaspirillum seropedicae]|uniref:hypothetical protein n=1 Tax=Herbaspirillum seropedicae TaxID=964 RepID=UPI003D95C280